MNILGYRLERTCSACPEQYDVFKDGKLVGYLRLRHGTFTVHCPDAGGELVYEAEPKGDGMFDSEKERMEYLTCAIRHIQKWMGRKNETCGDGDRSLPMRDSKPLMGRTAFATNSHYGKKNCEVIENVHHIKIGDIVAGTWFKGTYRGRYKGVFYKLPFGVLHFDNNDAFELKGDYNPNDWVDNYRKVKVKIIVDSTLDIN